MMTGGKRDSDRNFGQIRDTKITKKTFRLEGFFGFVLLKYVMPSSTSFMSVVFIRGKSKVRYKRISRRLHLGSLFGPAGVAAEKEEELYHHRRRRPHHHYQTIILSREAKVTTMGVTLSGLKEMGG